MRDRFYTLLLVGISIVLGYTLASRPAPAWNGGVAESAYRMANALEKIEQRLEHCQR